MRIISSFRDYYDHAAGYDDEPTPIYLRETRETVLTGRFGYWTSAPSSWTSDDGAALRAMEHLDGVLRAAMEEVPAGSDAAAFAIGFCGMTGVGWRWRGRVFYDAAKLAAAVGYSPHTTLAGARAVWPPTQAERAANLAVFRALDAPAFLIETEPTVRLLRDPWLAKLDLQRIVDPYTARQAVETYLSNELAAQVDPPQTISDEDRRDMKGFDDRSFKKGPGGPSRKRRKR